MSQLPIRASRVAALYDVHGNLPALEAVLADPRLEAVEWIVIGGDVGPGPMTAAAIELLAGRGEQIAWIAGNCERELVEAFDRGAGGDDDLWARRTAWSAAELTRPQRDRLAALPATAELELAGLGRTLFCHGSPRSDMEMITPATAERRLAPMLAGVAAAVVVCGHTHMQFDRRSGRHRVVNAGSVGMPYEGAAGAYWALLGPGVELVRTVYDVAAATARIEASGFPDAAGLVADLYLRPPTRDEAGAEFERQAAALESG